MVKCGAHFVPAYNKTRMVKQWQLVLLLLIWCQINHKMAMNDIHINFIMILDFPLELVSSLENLNRLAITKVISYSDFYAFKWVITCSCGHQYFTVFSCEVRIAVTQISWVSIICALTPSIIFTWVWFTWVDW